ncbi:unnamed protein product [Phytomonas sp. Hart1]|nr:unnamed protein product [Phytomonas sp. Hart1]|eukprot:CCW68967.1 unnamed protein product [Phytomonas sp. isolate Hart1]
MSKGYCWFDVTIGGKPLKERIIMELFDDVTPKTCENFRQLCLGNDGKTLEGSHIPMSYKGCTFHRVICGFMIQGGDYTNYNGTGGASIYGEKFSDENFEVACEKAGLLAMANAGPNTNGSQFFITAASCPHLTGRHVVFGRVVRGLDAVRAIEHAPTGANDKPEEDCVIADCGVLDLLPAVAPAADGDAHPDYPEDCEPRLTDNELIAAGESIRQIGNHHFKEGGFEAAIDKYTKASRYLQSVLQSCAEGAVVKEKLVACHNNMAMCFIKLGDFGAARRTATEALEIDQNNSKAFFRRGIAALSLGDAEGAAEDLTKSQSLEPENREITAKLNQAKEVIKARKAKLAAGLKKMFS